MRGMWKHLERLGGGMGSLGAGVGTRGPGESQLETDRRLARRRVTLLRRRLKDLGKQRDVRRKERQRSEAPTVALAGYTNVGKSTLLNALTDADVSVNDRLFETLDPTTRAFEYDGRRYLLTDTVGFIRRLPTQLVQGFAATLEETLVADLVLLVVDASAPDERLEEQEAAVRGVLHDIGADELPLEVVVNKIDAVDALRRRRLANRFPDAVQISALTGKGLDALPSISSFRTRKAGSWPSSTRWARRSTSARTRRTAFMFARGCRGARCAASRGISSRKRARSPCGARVDRAADSALAGGRRRSRASLRGRRRA